jgi:ABC-type lipoprotein release transport system permease subunit
MSIIGSIRIALNIALRNIRRRSWRTILILLSLTFTVASCISVGSVVSSIRTEVSDAQLCGREAGYPYYSDFIAVGFRYWYEVKSIREALLTESQLLQMQSIEGVSQVEPYFGSYNPVGFGFEGTSFLELQNGESKSFDSFIMIVGVDPELEAERWGVGSRMIMIQGGFLGHDSSNQAVVGYQFAEKHNVKVGDVLVIPRGLESDRKLFEFTEELRLKIVGIYWTGTEYDKQILTDLNTLQKGLGLENLYVCAFIRLTHEANATKVLEELWNMKGLDILVPSKGRVHFSFAGSGLFSYALPEPTKQMSIANFQTIITSLITTGIFVSATFWSSVRERQWEVGLLKVIGFSPRFISNELLLESLILGSISGIMGFISSYFLALISNTIASQFMPSIIFSAGLSDSITAVLLSIFLSMMSSYFPALFASDMSPIETLRRR